MLYLSNQTQGISRPVLIALICLLLTGCGALKSVQKKLSFIPGIDDPSKIATRSIRVTASREANNNSATALDLLFVLDKSATARLPKTAKLWFEDREGNINSVLGDVIVVPVELAPGGSVDVDMPRGYKKAEALMVFANYLPTRGQKLFKLPDEKTAEIWLDPQAVRIVSKKHDSKK